MKLQSFAAPIGTAILTTALIMLGLNLYVVPQIAETQAEARGGVTRFTSPVVFQDTVSANQSVTVAGALTGGATTASSLSVSGASTLTTLSVSGASTLTGAATFSANPILPTESITPTNGGTITPTASLVTLTPAGAVGVALGACTTGNSTVLYNSINANVVITDTGSFIGAGNQTLGQFDALPLVCLGSAWVQIGPVSSN